MQSGAMCAWGLLEQGYMSELGQGQPQGQTCGRIGEGGSLTSFSWAAKEGSPLPCRAAPEHVGRGGPQERQD